MLFLEKTKFIFNLFNCEISAQWIVICVVVNYREPSQKT